MLKFRCGHCNQKMGVPEEYAGKRVRCPRCKNAASVPLPSASLPQVQPTAAGQEAANVMERVEAASPPAPSPPQPAPKTPNTATQTEPAKQALEPQQEPPAQVPTSGDKPPVPKPPPRSEAKPKAPSRPAEPPPQTKEPVVEEPVVTAQAPPGFASIFAEHMPAATDPLRVSLYDLWDERLSRGAPSDAAPQPGSRRKEAVDLSQTMETEPLTAEVIDPRPARPAPARSSEDEVNDLLRDLRSTDLSADEPPTHPPDQFDELDEQPPKTTAAREEPKPHPVEKARRFADDAPSSWPAALLGVSGIAIGLSAISLCWVTGAARFAVPVGAAGLLLALAGVVLAALRDAPGVGVASVGAIVAALGIAVPILGAFGVVPLPGGVRVPLAGSTPVVNLTRPAAETSAIPAGEQASPDGFVSATSPLVLGDVQVRVSSARIVAPVVHDGKWNALHSLPDKCLVISLELKDVAKTGHIDYRSWGQVGPAEARATLTDGAGNALKEIDTAPLVPVGRVREVPAPLYPSRTAVPDVLIFEKPADTSHDLKLQLPGANVGVPAATLRIRIPVQMTQQ